MRLQKTEIGICCKKRERSKKRQTQANAASAETGVAVVVVGAFIPEISQANSSRARVGRAGGAVVGGGGVGAGFAGISVRNAFHAAGRTIARTARATVAIIDAGGTNGEGRVAGGGVVTTQTGGTGEHHRRSRPGEEGN